MATDGHPPLVTLAVSVGALVNVVVDVLAIAVFGWGIQGIDAGTLAQYAVNVLILSRYFRRPACSYRLIWPRERWRQLWANVKDGAPVTISNILMFGVENPEEMARLNHALRVYSPYLLCFALTLILVAVYQVLEREVLSIITVVSQLALVVAAARLFACHAPGHVWYAFPLTGGAFSWDVNSFIPIYIAASMAAVSPG